MNGESISDDEIVYRRIPDSQAWFEPPENIKEFNFKLNRKRGDLGISVYRASVVSATQVLAKPDAIPGSRIAEARVGDIRSLRSVAGVPLELDVIAADDEDDPGHAEIRGPEPGKLSAAASRRLTKLFKLFSMRPAGS